MDTNISAYWRARFHCANQRCIADKGIEPMTSRSQRVYYTNHQRGQGESNTRPNELQSFALPLSYDPSNYAHGFAPCLFNTLNNADRGYAASAALPKFIKGLCAQSSEPPARVELAHPFNRTPPGRGEKNSSCELVRDPVNLI